MLHAAGLSRAIPGLLTAFRCRWIDAERYPETWENEENVSPALVAAWEKEQGPEAFLQNGAGPRRQQKQRQRDAAAEQ